MTVFVGGKKVKVGDWVGFKSDIEQYGRITQVKQGVYLGQYYLTLENPRGFSGEYIGGQKVTVERNNDCWVD